MSYPLPLHSFTRYAPAFRPIALTVSIVVASPLLIFALVLYLKDLNST